MFIFIANFSEIGTADHSTSTVVHVEHSKYGDNVDLKPFS